MPIAKTTLKIPESIRNRAFLFNSDTLASERIYMKSSEDLWRETSAIIEKSRLARFPIFVVQKPVGIKVVCLKIVTTGFCWYNRISYWSPHGQQKTGWTCRVRCAGCGCIHDARTIPCVSPWQKSDIQPTGNIFFEIPASSVFLPARPALSVRSPAAAGLFLSPCLPVPGACKCFLTKIYYLCRITFEWFRLIIIYERFFLMRSCA